MLLMDHAQFNDLRLYWLNPIGASTHKGKSKGKIKDKTPFRSEDPCKRWNHGVCRSKASKCRFIYVKAVEAPTRSMSVQKEEREWLEPWAKCFRYMRGL